MRLGLVRMFALTLLFIPLAFAFIPTKFLKLQRSGVSGEVFDRHGSRFSIHVWRKQGPTATAALSAGSDLDYLIDADSSSSDFLSGFVAILGNPNMGKSTLMNRLLGEDLCITSPKPQTTRHRIMGVLTKPGEYQLVFSDTPGMLVPAYQLQETMQDAVSERSFVVLRSNRCSERDTATEP